MRNQNKFYKRKINVIFILIVLLLFQNSCNENNDRIDLERQEDYYFCDAEKLSKDEKYFIAEHDSTQQFSAVKFRSDKYSHSGNYSIKLDQNNKHGFEVQLKNLSSYDQYKFSVWRFKPDKNDKEGGIAICSPDYAFFKFSQEVVEVDKNGWELIELSFTLNEKWANSELKMYVSAAKGGDVYFDDFKLIKVAEVEYKYPTYVNIPTFRIHIDTIEMAKLHKIRKQAFDKGILETTDDSWIKAVIFYEDEMYKAKLRLKGDWLDHLQGKKWSFRVKIKKNNSWHGMKEFSIQNPESRYFLSEWFAHKIIEKEKGLSPRYGFIPVMLNNKSLGIYAFEEHFTKQLVEAKKRREGPIIKFAETGFWTIVKINNKEKKWFNVPIFEASKILPYKQSKTIKSENLFNQFLIAQNLLYEYKYCIKPISEIFDVDKLARFYAIVDLTKTYHAIRWHNQRFYYNPVISKLEIIGYDGYTSDGILPFIDRAIVGNFKPDEIIKCEPENRIIYQVFSDSIFVEKYIEYLKIYSNPEYLNQFFSELKQDLEVYEEALNKEYEKYIYDTNFIYENARLINQNISIYSEKVKSGYYKSFSFIDAPKKQYPADFHKLLPIEYISAYSQQSNLEETKYKIINYLPVGISFLGISENDNYFGNKTLDTNSIGKYNSENNIISISDKIFGKYMFFSTDSLDTIFSIPITPWKAPMASTPRQELNEKNIFPNNKFYTINENKIIFNTGKLQIKENIIIPENYTVFIEAGTELDFIENSIFISYSSVQITGSENNKVIIKSSDATGMGFTVLQASKKSYCEYVVFDGLNTLNYNGWILTGAVNFYESEVEIKNTVFKNNNCEDILNIISSNFLVDNCTFNNVFSDAFDSDFSTGILTNSQFYNIGNDAIDFSGSEVEIRKCKITDIGDKGISGGEASTLIVKECEIEKSNIGIASKDKSVVEIVDCKITNCVYGLVALQKKPEYGPSKIITKKTKVKSNITFHLIEKKSSLNYNGRYIQGREKNVSKRFY